MDFHFTTACGAFVYESWAADFKLQLRDKNREHFAEAQSGRCWE
jgi:hypothetical protein